MFDKSLNHSFAFRLLPRKLYRIPIEGGTEVPITSNELGTSAVTTPKIAAYAITAAKIATGAVASISIGTGSINTSELAAFSVIEGKIATNAVSTAKIQTNAISTAKITAFAIVAGKIATDAITSAKIGSNQIIAAKIKAFAVTTGKIATNAIGSNKIQASGVTEGKIAGSAVTAGKVATDAITTAKIAAFAVLSGKIPTSAISTAKLAAFAVLEGKIATGAIAISKIKDGTDGELITWDSSGVAAVVGAGNVGEVLTSRGVGLPPTFQAAAGGGTLTKVAETELSSAGTSLKVTGISVELDPSVSDVNSQVIVYCNLLGSNAGVLTLDLNTSTSMRGNDAKIASGIATFATFNSGDASITSGDSVTQHGGLIITIGCGQETSAIDAPCLTYWWQYPVNHDATYWGLGQLKTPRETLLTDVEIISTSGNLAIGSLMAVYRVTR